MVGVSHLRLEYLRKKRVFFVIEQPSTSLMPMYRPLEAHVLIHSSHTAAFNILGLTMYGLVTSQELLVRHGADFYFLPMGMMGGNTENHGCTG